MRYSLYSAVPPRKYERPGKKPVREHLDQCAADDQVLLDLSIVNPRCNGAPGRNVVSRDHVSASTRALTSSRQSRERVAPSAGADGNSLV